MKPLHIFGLVFLLSMLSVSAYVINPNATGANSETYLQNYNDLVGFSLLTGFNTTISFSNGSMTFLTTPEYDSSTTQKEANLVETYTGATANFTLYEIRTDLMSEQGIALAGSNYTTAFDNWVNTLEQMAQCGYGSLPCWVIIRDGNTFRVNSSANDTAIDGTLRAVQALYIAYTNDNFNSSQKARYLALANQMMADSYAYETISITSSTTDYGTVNRVPMGGADCAGFGLGCSVDMWSGYLGDIGLTYEMAYNITGNSTYLNFANNVSAIITQFSRQNDTDGDGFGVMPFNFNYAGAGSTLYFTGGGGVNSYHYNPANSQWDDSDAPRHYVVGQLLHYVNQTRGLSGPYVNLSDYVSDWISSGTMTSTTSCLQYYYNGTCSTTVQSGYYQNGFGGLLYLSKSYNNLSAKLNETLTHYSFSGKTFDSTSGGNGLTYRGVRTTKLLGASIGLYDVSLSSSSAGNTTLTDFIVSWGNSSDTISGGNGSWIADIITYGNTLIANSSGVYLYGVRWNQTINSQIEACTASYIPITTTVNTSTLKDDYSSYVTCSSTAPSVVIENACNNDIGGLGSFAGKTSLIVLVVIAVFSLAVITQMSNPDFEIDLNFIVVAGIILTVFTIIISVGVQIVAAIC